MSMSRLIETRARLKKRRGVMAVEPGSRSGVGSTRRAEIDQAMLSSDRAPGNPRRQGAAVSAQAANTNPPSSAFFGSREIPQAQRPRVTQTADNAALLVRGRE